MSNIDLSHVNLLLCSPSGSGEWQDSYVESKDATKFVLEKYGAKFEWKRGLYCADIALIRSRLFASFYKCDEFTHMLMVDSDMAWHPEDVVRMLLLDRQFLAVAGPRKKYPKDFAYNMWGPNGEIVPFAQEVGTNVAMDIPFVGGAFVMIKKEVATRLITSYPELEYDVSPGVTEYALFDPVIIPGKTRRRLSEDYAFCYRWRQIGGKVQLLTDATLGHTGAHTFIGSLEEELSKKEGIMGIEPEIREATDGERQA